MALLSTIWSVYAAWTFYKAVEYGVDVCLLATVLVMATKSEEWKKFTDWTWILFGIMLVNVWLGCIWDPLDALAKGGIYGQATIVISSVMAIIVSGFWQTLYLYVQRGQGANAFDSLSGRIEWWEVALDKFSNYPFTGLGMWAAARFGVLAKIGYTSTATIHSV